MASVFIASILSVQRLQNEFRAYTTVTLGRCFLLHSHQLQIANTDVIKHSSVEHAPRDIGNDY